MALQSTATGAPRWNLALIQTKMTPPPPPRGRVGRRVLMARLEAAAGRALTVVAAPAGFGKTSLLAEWCAALRAKQHVVAWLSLDAEDDEPQQFCAYVLESLCLASDGVGELARELLRDDPLTPFQSVTSVLLNELAACQREVFLVLDDFDRLAAAPIGSMVSRLLRYAPPNFHILLGVRGEPCLALGRIQAQEQLLRLDSADLRFSADEAQAFFEQAGGPALDRRGVELLHDATEGWVAGLQLASLALREAGDAAHAARGLAAARRGVDAYLDETVLAQLPPPMLEFLLRTCILDRLGAGVCDAILGAAARSGDKLDWLERHNVFIRALDDERAWFRYHALLSDALRRRAACQLPDELALLHRRASDWFAAEGLWPEAVRHALAGGAMQQAAEWVEHSAMLLVDRSDVRTLLGWLAKLPPELLKQRPRLCLAEAWALALSFQIGAASAAVLSLASTLAPAPGEPDAHPLTALAVEVTAVSAGIAGFADDSPRALELGRLGAASPLPAPAWVRRFAQTAQVFGLLHEGRFDEVRRLRAAATIHLGDGQAPIYADVYRESMFGLSAMMEGRLAEAAGIFEAAFRRAAGAVGPDSAAAAVPAGYLAALHYERGDLARAQELVGGRAALALEACPLGSLLRYSRAAACLHARRGELGVALTVLEEARQVATERQWLRLRAGCDAEAMRLCLRDGRIAQARQIADALQAAMPEQAPDRMGSFLETWACHCTAQARLCLATGRPGEAALLLDALHGKLAAAGMQYLDACACLLLALACERGGARAAAWAALERALRFAQSNGMVGSLVDEGEALRALLCNWRREALDATWIDPAYFERLLAAFDAGAAPPAGVVAGAKAAGAALLTAREREILEHIARGLSNKEIARALLVAPETIKWHLKNIYEKLDASSRIQAVQLGLGLGLPVRQCADGPVDSIPPPDPRPPR